MMRLTLSDIEGSELHSWFGLHEIGRRPSRDGRVAIHLKPGGYQESVDLWVEVDETGAIDQARLALVRAWVDDAATAPFALDLTKSVVQVLSPDSAVLQRVADHLWQRVGASQRVIRRAGAGPSLPPPATGTEAILAVYAGERDRAHLADGGIAADIENEAGGAASRLVLTLSFLS